MITALSVTGHQHLVRRSSELPGVEVVRGVHIGPPPKWHFIPMVQIHVVEAGAARIWCCGRSHVVGPGDVVVNAPNHNPRIDERLTPFASTLRVYLAPCLFDSLTRPAGGPFSEAFTLEVIRDWRVAQLLEALAQDIAEGEPGTLLERELGELVEKSAKLLRTRNKGDLTPLARRPEIERARHLLQERFDQPVRLEELTQASGMSKFHLLRLFRDLVGKTPHAYQMHLRIARARELLDRGVRSVDVAFMCGFTDQSHFSRCFKEIVGYTPGKFARFA